MYPWGVRLCLDTMCILTQFHEFSHLIQFTYSCLVLWGPSFISLQTTTLNKSYSVSSNKKEIGAWWISLSTYLSTCLPIYPSVHHLSIINYVSIYLYRDVANKPDQDYHGFSPHAVVNKHVISENLNSQFEKLYTTWHTTSFCGWCLVG